MVELRPYQIRAAADVRAAWSTHRRVLLALPTGAGKTELAIHLAEETAAAGHRVLVVVDRKVLVGQWVARFQKSGYENVGILQGENTSNTDAPVVVATVQTIRTRGVPLGSRLVVIDEAHILHQAHDALLASLTPYVRVLGLSATPLRGGLGSRFGALVVGSTIRELTTEGFLVPTVVYAPGSAKLEEALDHVHLLGGEYNAGELGQLMRRGAIIGDVVKSWQARAAGLRTLTFCVDKEHAREVAKKFRDVGVAADCIVDETPDDERKAILSRFSSGETLVLTSVAVLGIGFDAPEAACAILARPTLSTMLYVQQVGRVLRTFPGKERAIILDHAANTVRHGLPIAFEPPPKLRTEEEAETEKKSRNAKHRHTVVCVGCAAVYERKDFTCPSCGHTRPFMSSRFVVDGEVEEVRWEPGQLVPRHLGPTLDDARRVYSGFLGYCEQFRWSRREAFILATRRLGLSEDPANHPVFPKEWRVTAVADRDRINANDIEWAHRQPEVNAEPIPLGEGDDAEECQKAREVYAQVLHKVLSRGWKPGAAFYRTCTYLGIDTKSRTALKALSRVWQEKAKPRFPAGDVAQWLEEYQPAR